MESTSGWFICISISNCCVVLSLGKLALGSINGTGEIGGGGLIGVSLWALRRFEDKPFVSESCLRLVFVFVLLLSLLLLAVIGGSLTLTIRRGLSSDGDGDSCASPLIGGAGVRGGGGGGIDADDVLLLSVCDVLSRPCHERRSFFARWAMSIRDGG